MRLGSWGLGLLQHHPKYLFGFYEIPTAAGLVDKLLVPASRKVSGLWFRS